MNETTTTTTIPSLDKPLTKRELVSIVAETRGMELTKKQTGEILDLFVDLMKRQIKRHRRLRIAGFGTFTIRVRRARMGVHPKTGQTIKIPARRVVAFKAAPEYLRTI